MMWELPTESTHPKEEEKMASLSRGGASSPPVLAAFLLTACFVVPMLAGSRVVLPLHQFLPSREGIELQRHGRELLGDRSPKISNPAPTDRGHTYLKSPPPSPRLPPPPRAI
ncbi:hypothetical protein H6P81_005220 [Aristolochia fimbriata]|uniref:Uncharacterized protein n=1 Tax=Aristolochia fimbriata TaxID=158543 RepID=A0AAV7EV02_ARIFI|nr:hypothetical protein H6P81_005220 [Aristolochia fimbriata]